ncbi:hypothetical protein CMI47_18565 [Candidatus Pacearchaeota archaeon]|nr:hypothetical protein [Candidatus Pacearchaeota archaeon]|tara:strand:+ start:127 stop:459 length:333 start_codon:yes stop_codon:yes gene_type:complete
MILKTLSKNHEHQTKITVETPQLLKNILPSVFMRQIDSFIKRNSLGVSACSLDKKLLHTYCPQCLKAHALKTALSVGLDQELTELIEELFEDFSEGHNGFYLDNGELNKV